MRAQQLLTVAAVSVAAIIAPQLASAAPGSLNVGVALAGPGGAQLVTVSELAESGIIRNRLKINGAITNAKLFLEVQKEFRTFDQYIWQFTGYKTLRDPRGMRKEYFRATSPESDALSKDLKARGFKFVGSTIIYAHMQATGMVDDHIGECWRYVSR